MDAERWLGGRYQLRWQIGAGGIGQVWMAHDQVLGREVAIKLQKADPDGDPSAFERFVREARSAATLQHPNVVTIFDSGTEGDTAFLVMELLPGPTLTGYLALHGPLAEQEAIALAGQVAAGLAAAHCAGVVHRDIKPANLMFDARGTLKIVDFGIARLTQATATRLTATNAVIGSPPYLSPEQLHGQQADERSDIYSLGGVMMTMLTGRAPFEETHPLALLEQHLTAPPPQIRDRRPGIDPALNALVAQMLSASPQDRPQSAVEVLSCLTGSTHQASTGAAIVDTLQTAPQSAAHASSSPGSVARPRQRSLLGTGILAGAAAMALVAALVVSVATTAESPTASRSEPSPPAPMPVAGEASRSKPSSRFPTPAAAEARKSKPSPSDPTSVTSSEQASSRPTAPRAADTNSDEPGLQQALVNLRAAVRDVSSSGQIDAKKAEELGRRLDVLTKHVDKKRGEDATKKVDEMARYLAGLAKKRELTADAEQRIATALFRVRELVDQA